VFGTPSHASAMTLSPTSYSSNLIDDSVFEDNTTMTASQIQSFLNSEGSGLANFRDVENCGSSSGPHYSYYTRYYRCGTSQVAAQIIYDAAQAYGINPRAIIATMQKEQSLITTPNPASSQLNYAMGYGCPDSSGCSGYVGFFNQVDNGAWQLKTDMELGTGNNWWGYTPASYPCNGRTQYYSTALKGGNTVTFYDDGGTAYNTLTLANMATASLYCYTPHVYNNPSGLYGLPKYGTKGDYYTGSYNFVYYFTLWFGSTTGDLVRTTGSAQVYIVNEDNGYKYPVNSLSLLNDFSTLGLRYVTSAYLNGFTTGQPADHMVQGSNSALYLVNAGIKMPFSSCSGDVVSYGFTCASSDYIPLTIGETNKLVNGPHVTSLLKGKSSATVYYITNGTKRPISTWSDASSFGIPTTYNTLTDQFVGEYPSAANLIGAGNLVKTASSKTVYAVKDMSHLMPLTTLLYPQELGLGTSVRTISNADFQNGYGSGSGATNLTTKLLCNSNDYVGTNGVLYLVSSGMMTNYGYNSSDFIDAGSICARVKISSQGLSQYIRTSNGTIYFVSGGQKHAFGSYSTYQSPSYCNNTCAYTQVSDLFANSIPVGSKITH